MLHRSEYQKKNIYKYRTENIKRYFIFQVYGTVAYSGAWCCSKEMHSRVQRGTVEVSEVHFWEQSMYSRCQTMSVRFWEYIGF